MITLKQGLLVFGLFVATLVLLEAIMLLRLKLQVQSHKNYWALQAQTMPKDNSLWYVAMGDSAAQGIGASSPQDGYVGLLAKTLANQTGRPVHVVNLSVNGAKITNLVNNQIPKLKRLSLPKDSIITLEIGANDMKNFQPQRFETELDNLLGMVPPTTLVSDVPYFGKGIYKSREGNVLAANKIVAELLAKHKLQLVPLHLVTMKRSSWRNDAADLFHPNNRGYVWWYEAFWQILRQV